jgi:hypothetical protein
MVFDRYPNLDPYGTFSQHTLVAHRLDLDGADTLEFVEGQALGIVLLRRVVETC